MIAADPAQLRRLAACVLVRALTDWLVYTGHRKRRGADPAPPWQPLGNQLPPAAKAYRRRRAITELVDWLTTPQWAHEWLDVDPRRVAALMSDPERVRGLIVKLEKHAKRGRLRSNRRRSRDPAPGRART